MTDASEIVIEGSHGEGGGQILRTALALSVITGRRLIIERIRACRPKPGLAAQHLAAVWAAARLCNAEVTGADLGATTLAFRPRETPRAGNYTFDVAEARAGGSAGAAALVLQTVALPAFFADGTSTFSIRGGSHVPWSPPFDYIADVWCRFLERIGISLHTDLAEFGFYSAGGGQLRARIEGRGQGAGLTLRPVTVTGRGALRAIRGRAIAANLPSHIPQRMVDRRRALFVELGCRVEIRPELVRARSAGAGIFLAAEYDHVTCGFSALGARGKSSEQVADDAALALLRHQRSGAALEHHLADQVLLPLSLARLPSAFTTEAVTSHLETNAWMVEQFGLARISIQQQDNGTTVVSVNPSAGTSTSHTSHAPPL